MVSAVVVPVVITFAGRAVPVSVPAAPLTSAPAAYITKDLAFRVVLAFVVGCL